MGVHPLIPTFKGEGVLGFKVSGIK